MKKLLVGLMVLGGISSHALCADDETLVDEIVSQRDYSLVSSTEEDYRNCPFKISFILEDSGAISLEGSDPSHYTWLLSGLDLSKVNKGTIRTKNRDSEWQIISKQRIKIEADKNNISLTEVGVAKDTILDYVTNIPSGFIRPYAQRTFMNKKRIVTYTKTATGFEVSGEIIDRVLGSDVDKRDPLNCLYESI